MGKKENCMRDLKDNLFTFKQANCSNQILFTSSPITSLREYSKCHFHISFLSSFYFLSLFSPEFFFKFIFYSVIALQNFVVFCQTST